jgi:3',5'-cyclic AMP phosphodiesterase CpdA
MADPQLGMLDGDKSFTRDAKLYEQAISDANRLKPACVVICGDLVNNCGIRAQHEEFARISRLLDKSIPLYLVAGNHDVQNAPTTQSVAGYRLLHGPDRYSFNLRGCHFVVLDSSLFYDCRNSPKEAAAQIEWLKDDLKQAAAAEPVHVFVFMHHPPYTRTLDEKDDYSQLPKERRQMVLDIFKGGGVTAVFTGHTHRNADAQPYGSVQLVNTSAVGKQLGAAQSGFRIVRVYKDTFQTDYVALDKCPQEVDMTLHAQTRPFATTRAAGAAAD